MSRVQDQPQAKMQDPIQNIAKEKKMAGVVAQVVQFKLQ
jgi:hypothetical protein